jgi:hypothetical protein
MDARRFDTATLAFATTKTRRRAFVSLIASSLVSAAGPVADAKRGKSRKVKRRQVANREANGGPDRVSAAKRACRQEGHPCEGHQDCCGVLECEVSGPGKARRCTAPSCAEFQEACAVDSDCCPENQLLGVPMKCIGGHCCAYSFGNTCTQFDDPNAEPAFKLSCGFFCGEGGPPQFLDVTACEDAVPCGPNGECPVDFFCLENQFPCCGGEERRCTRGCQTPFPFLP